MEQSPTPRTHKWSSSTPLKQEDSDVIILVMGSSGTGRSTFINALLGSNCTQKMPTGEQICTTSVEHIVMDPIGEQGYRLVLVDTPGLNIPKKLDSKVFGSISDWIQKWCGSRRRRGAVVFMHDLTLDRFERECQYTTVIGHHLDIAIVTSKWKYCKNPGPQRRHQIVGEGWVQPTKGASFHPFRNEGDAWEIIGNILARLEADSSRRRGVDLWSVFNDLKTSLEQREVSKDKETEKEKKSFLSKFLSFLGIGKKGGVLEDTQNNKPSKKGKKGKGK